jgi:rhodanese-related sulfurtransferase
MEPSIPCWQLLLRLGEDELLVLDCRPREERGALAVQIPGALTVTEQELDEDPDLIPDDELVVIYDGEQDGHLARQMWRRLHRHGRSAVWLRGGIEAWVAAGYPVEPAGRPAGWAQFVPEEGGSRPS